MKLANKIPFLLMFPVSAVAVYFIGANVKDLPSLIVDGSRQWLLILMSIFSVNYIVAWFMKSSWAVSMGRMLICGLFAYIAISELVDLLGDAWGNWGQLLGGAGKLDEVSVSAIRYAATAWTVGLVLMILCIAIGFESNPNDDLHRD